MLRGRYRWWIAGLLFLSTVINYIDRQTLSVLAPTLKQEFNWSNQNFALVLISFRAAYAVMQVVSGRVLDRVGTKNGLTFAVAWYSTVGMLTSLANGLGSFCAARFMLGAGEAANWPGATKAVSEWFPHRERGWAVALFDSGSSVGAAIAPALVLWLLATAGGWRPVFLITGSLGFLWIVAWRLSYYTPEGDADGAVSDPADAAAVPPLRELLRLRQTWGAIASRALTDPVWFMVTDWFAIYLMSRGFQLSDTVAGFWIPFLAADLGNFFGGGLSSVLIQRGWSVGRARKALLVGGAVGVLALVPAAFLSDFWALISCFAIATFSYAAMSTMALSLPADLFHTRVVASVAGMAGTGAGLGTIVSTFLIGIVADRFSFAPILVTASVVPLTAVVLVLVLVRNTSNSGHGVLKVI